MIEEIGHDETKDHSRIYDDGIAPRQERFLIATHGGEPISSFDTRKARKERRAIKDVVPRAREGIAVIAAPYEKAIEQDDETVEGKVPFLWDELQQSKAYSQEDRANGAHRDEFLAARPIFPFHLSIKFGKDFHEEYGNEEDDAQEWAYCRDGDHEQHRNDDFDARKETKILRAHDVLLRINRKECKDVE